MEMITRSLLIMVSVFFVSLFAASLPTSTRISAAALTRPSSRAELRVKPTPEASKTYSEYKGIAIGMTADAVRQKLGNPKDKGTEQDLYTFSDTESAQF